MNIEIVNLGAGKYLPPKKGARLVYIGRNGIHKHENYGNPFSHLKKKTLAEIQVPTRDEAIQAYQDWLAGTAWTEVEPERRAWILSHIDELARDGNDLMLGCWCAPARCHGEILRDLILAARREFVLASNRQGEEK
jgi:hypothetical protein